MWEYVEMSSLTDQQAKRQQGKNSFAMATGRVHWGLGFKSRPGFSEQSRKARVFDKAMILCKRKTFK